MDINFVRAPPSLRLPLNPPLLYQSINKSTKSKSAVFLLKLSFITTRELSISHLYINTHPTSSTLLFLYAPPFSVNTNPDGVQGLFVCGDSCLQAADGVSEFAHFLVPHLVAKLNRSVFPSTSNFCRLPSKETADRTIFNQNSFGVSLLIVTILSLIN